MKITVSRRTFITSLGVAKAAGPVLLARRAGQDKREALMSLRKGGAGPDHVLGAFFVHFGGDYRFGPAVGGSASIVTGGPASIPGLFLDGLLPGARLFGRDADVESVELHAGHVPAQEIEQAGVHLE